MIKRNLIAQSLLLIFFVTILPPLSFADENRRDGNWWQAQGKLTRHAYIVGFFDGMELGHHFSFWSFLKEEGTDSCRLKVWK